MRKKEQVQGVEEEEEEEDRDDDQTEANPREREVWRGERYAKAVCFNGFSKKKHFVRERVAGWRMRHSSAPSSLS